jgi:hypothetical protein
MSGIYPLETLGIKSTGQPPKWKLEQQIIGNWQQLVRAGPQPGWFLLGTNDLFHVEHEYDWLHSLTPIKRIGYSVYIFHVTLDEVNHIREQYDLPMLIEEDFE